MRIIPSRRICRAGTAALPLAFPLTALLWAVPGHAQTALPAERQGPSPGPTGASASPTSPAANSPAPTSAAPTSPAAPTGFWERSNLLGDMGGLRTALANYGISFGLTETDEVLGNVTGGVHRGADYDGITEMSLGLDTSKAFGWAGGTFNISALQIHGRNLDSDNLDAFAAPSGLSSNPATRLWELWYDQTLPGGKVDIKVGQQSVDQEFILDPGSSLFMNLAMGWPTLPSADLYAGGPAYPVSSLGARVRVQPTDAITVLAGVFDDNPAGGSFYDDTPVLGSTASGTRFNLGTGALFLAEIDYALNPVPASPPPAGAPAPGLPGLYKFGFWYDTGNFYNQRIASDGLLLADPDSTGIGRTVWNNFSLYAIADQTVWRPDPQGPRAVGVFARMMGAPGNRNLVNFAMDAGVTLKAPLKGRDNDTVGFGFGLTHVSGSVADYDEDLSQFTGSPVPVRGSETFFELTYQAQVTPWWTVQPDLQYIVNPGGGLSNPLDPGQKIGNEFVLGLRSNVVF